MKLNSLGFVIEKAYLSPGRTVRFCSTSKYVTGFNERLRELCAKTRVLEAPSLRVLCATRREHFIKCPFSGGLYPPLKQKSVYPPPIEAGVLRAFDKYVTAENRNGLKSGRFKCT
jgi:hypothetical protein